MTDTDPMAAARRITLDTTAAEFVRDARVVARALLTIRAWVLEEAARIAENGCLVPPDGGAPTDGEREMCASIAAAIRTLIEKEPT